MNTKMESYVIIASMKSETMDKMINRIPGHSPSILYLRGHMLKLPNYISFLFMKISLPKKKAQTWMRYCIL